MKLIKINYIQFIIMFFLGAGLGVNTALIFLRLGINDIYLMIIYLGIAFGLTFNFRKELLELETRLKLGDQ